ncbi:cystatin C (amyloid angiopathy and cerebral hemorrhage) [Melanotaenia boesemani]|uniref:cystatin C (amyloid angiopathy and cerebral hemorrhage) n=1 Tax=Melanotaenia boesemani TaxID=1250792 RepID=UPI001C054E2D|nr:cystatin C (amyloid angiopathy and cerebral hemorrhage) [Melanotaenia boesemani]
MMWKIVVTLLAAVFAVGLSFMTGGLRDADINDEGVQNAVNFAAAQHNRGTNDMFLHQVVEVVRAQTQVVAGMKYVITVKMAKTNCRKDRDNENCGVLSTQPYECTFTVWSRPWINDIRLTKNTC